MKNGNSQKSEGNSGFEELFIRGHEKKLDRKMGVVTGKCLKFGLWKSWSY